MNRLLSLSNLGERRPPRAANTIQRDLRALDRYNLLCLIVGGLSLAVLAATCFYLSATAP